MKEIEEGDLFLFETFMQTDKITFSHEGRKLVEGVVVAYKRNNGDMAFADLFGEPSSTRWSFEMKDFHKLIFISNTSEISIVNFIN